MLPKLVQEVDNPTDFLCDKFIEYCKSPVGRSEAARNPERLMNDRFWEDDPADWGESLAINRGEANGSDERQTFDGNAQGQGISSL